MKYIGLLDCNNFFVSCERLFRPDLEKRPVAVLSSNDGCIVARSQEVKAMGVPMGLPLFQAKQLVDMDKVTLFSSNFTLYRDISARVMKALQSEVGEVQVYSIDEAFFTIEIRSEAELLKLRQRIMQKTGIPVSIGTAATKTLAKEASEIGKRGTGVCLLTSERWRTHAVAVPCGEIWNLGRSTAAKLKTVDVATADQFMQLDRSFVRKNFGLAGERIFDELHGTAIYKLTDPAANECKSVTSSRSFAQAVYNLSALKSAVAYHVALATKKIRRRQLVATNMYIEMRASRHGDFAYQNGGVDLSLTTPSHDTMHLTQLALRAVVDAFDPEVPYKKAGITLSGLVPEQYLSKSLFSEEAASSGELDTVLDALQNQFGFDALHSAAILPSRDRSSHRLRSPAYTTNWKDIPRVQA